MKVKLFTRTGGFVHEQEIPPFNEQPDVILWGERVFKTMSVDNPAASPENYEPDDYPYEEAWTYALVPSV